MKCDHAVQLCTCCICECTVYTLPSVGWSFFSRQPKPVLTLRKMFTNRQDLKNAENSNWSSSTGFGPTLTTMTKLFAGWPAILTMLSAGFPATLGRTSNLFWVNRVAIFFVALKLSFSLSYLSTARNGSVFFLGPCQVLVMQSFAFSFRLSKVGSLIE